eukprot:2258437-Pyramimonas_sp.AAC.1
MHGYGRVGTGRDGLGRPHRVPLAQPCHMYTRKAYAGQQMYTPVGRYAGADRCGRVWTGVDGCGRVWTGRDGQ